MVFLNSPCRETPKNVLKKNLRKKKSDGGWVGLGFSQCTGGSVDFFFAGPSTISRKTSDSTDKLNGQNPLDVAVTNALELLRGQNFEN